MVPLYYKDERVKVGLLVLVALIIQGIIFCFIYFTSINNINERIIMENQSIVGTVAAKDEQLAKEIIPIITNNDYTNTNIGENILSQYYYDSSLKFFENPLISQIGYKVIIWSLILILITTIVLVIGLNILLDPLYKKIKSLTNRAENIVENKFTDDDIAADYSGSLDKFVLKFSLMEERIINNIELLQYEKINLKNIINDISHQLKTPLMALQMYNDILQDHSNMEEDEVDNFVSLSSEQLQRMEWLVKTLLKFARLESNVVEYHKENFSLNNTIEESMNPLVIKAEEKNQILVFKESKDVTFYHDRKWIAEALSNIIKNAIEHTSDNGIIEVSIDETPISITIAVGDNGEGIEKSQIKKIFNRFHKGENAINPTSIGIGLYLSKCIIKAHNGDITVESEVGVGSTFYITFLKSAVS